MRKLALQTMLGAAFQSKFTRGHNSYWIILLWKREGLLLRKQWPFRLRLLVAHTHMSLFSSDVVISTVGRFQRPDSAKGSVH